MHPLDRPIWTALTTRQAHLNVASDPALRRLPPDVSSFAAAADAAASSLLRLGDLIAVDDDISLVEAAPPSAPDGIEATSAPIVQMTTQGLAGAGRFSPRAEDRIEALGDADAPEMLALASLTRPGPFRARTHSLGRFIGVRRDGRLIAMCGERLLAPGFAEVSALCTHPDHRGDGLGETLFRQAVDRLLAEGETVFLHAYATNEKAIAMYQRIGFSVRANLTHAIWRRSPRSIAQ